MQYSASEFTKLKSNKLLHERRTPRRQFDRPVGVLFKGKYQIIKAVQISEGGVLLELPGHIKVGDHLLMNLILKADRGYAVSRGEVLYVNEDVSDGFKRMGIKFFDLSSRHKRFIRDYIASKSEEEISKEES